MKVAMIDRTESCHANIEPALVKTCLYEVLCGKLADPVLHEPRYGPYTKGGRQGVDGSVIRKILFSVTEGRDSLSPVGEVTVCVKQLSLYPKAGELCSMGELCSTDGRIFFKNVL